MSAQKVQYLQGATCTCTGMDPFSAYFQTTSTDRLAGKERIRSTGSTEDGSRDNASATESSLAVALWYLVLCTSTWVLVRGRFRVHSARPQFLPPSAIGCQQRPSKMKITTWRRPIYWGWHGCVVVLLAVAVESFVLVMRESYLPCSVQSTYCTESLES